MITVLPPVCFSPVLLQYGNRIQSGSVLECSNEVRRCLYELFLHKKVYLSNARSVSERMEDLGIDCYRIFPPEKYADLLLFFQSDALVLTHITACEIFFTYDGLPVRGHLAGTIRVIRKNGIPGQILTFDYSGNFPKTADFAKKTDSAACVAYLIRSALDKEKFFFSQDCSSRE